MTRKLSASFQSWLAYVDTMNTSRDKVGRIVLKLQKKSLVAAMDAWIITVAESKESRIRHEDSLKILHDLSIPLTSCDLRNTSGPSCLSSYVHSADAEKASTPGIESLG